MQRRLMYHHHKLKRPKHEHISKFYNAQRMTPSKGDSVTTIENEKKRAEINLTDDAISLINYLMGLKQGKRN